MDCFGKRGIGNLRNKRYHPTQKPVALLQYLIKTYTKENETVLDFTMGSGSTGVACMNANRKFIGIELDENLSPAEKLKVVQGLMNENDPRATAIYDTIGVYFGYAIAYYSLFYDIKHVLLMGRVSSGEGGNILYKRK